MAIYSPSEMARLEEELDIAEQMYYNLSNPKGVREHALREVRSIRRLLGMDDLKGHNE